MGQLVSSRRPFRGAYEQLANEEDELLETSVESCAISTGENESLKGASGDIADVTGSHVRNRDALESIRRPLKGPLSFVTTHARRESNRSDMFTNADGKASRKELVAAPGSGMLVKVTECVNCGNTCTESAPRQRLPRSRSM